MKNKRVEELKKKIESLEETIFYLEMVDNWTRKHFDLSNKYDKELKQLKELLIQEIID